jgi:sodium/bile acid cotransporter 7
VVYHWHIIIKAPVGYLNQGIIIFIVFAAFSNSVVGGVWKGQGASLVVLTIIISLIIFLVVLIVCLSGVHILRFAIEDQPAIFFCSTQKTLAAAVPLGISLFGSDPTFGVILLPAIIYHPIQLIFGAFFFGRFRKQIIASEQI